jgi:uncharacterized protein (DUF1697 family)
MHQFIALLRGINLGRRRLKMDRLRALFEALKFTDIATFIASGNVIFASKSGDGSKLTRQIQTHLRRELGYEVDTFVRTRAEIAAANAFQPFATADLNHPAHTVYAGFLQEALTTAQSRALVACRTEIDEFCVNGREFYWLCRIKSNDSKIWSSPRMKAVALPSMTMRNRTTVRRLAAEFPVVAM